jgi:hypothetical protein
LLQQAPFPLESNQEGSIGEIVAAAHHRVVVSRAVRSNGANGSLVVTLDPPGRIDTNAHAQACQVVNSLAAAPAQSAGQEAHHTGLRRF